jgi:hypothetical protein
VQESMKLELMLQRCGEKNFMDLLLISETWLGVYLELFLKIRVASWKFVDYRLILNKYRGPFAKWHGILDSGFIS